jgi:hypothetical protein
VAPGQYHGPLRNADIIADRDRHQAVYPHIFANPNLVTNGKPPGIFDVYTGFDLHFVANFCAE